MVNFVLDKRGFGLLEFVLWLSIVSILGFAVVISFTKYKKIAKTTRVVNDSESIATAAQLYYSANTSTWPIQITDLQPDFLSSNITTTNVFGNGYTITSTVNQVTVSSNIPADLINKSFAGTQVTITNVGAEDQIQVTLNAPLGSNGELRYDKVYGYN